MTNMAKTGSIAPLWQRLSEFTIGLLFGWGLLLSGMTDPGKVLGFLDLAGAWDPSLAVVMGAALLVGLPGFYRIRAQSRSWLGKPMHLPTNTQLDKRLVAGAVMFGSGWGLAGFCPGPALVSSAAGYSEALIFTAAMLAGMALFEVVQRITAQSESKGR